MKKLLLFLIFLCSAALAQSAPETLSLGSVPLHLGMSKADVLNKLQKAGYVFNPDSGVVVEKSPGRPSTLSAL